MASLDESLAGDRFDGWYDRPFGGHRVAVITPEDVDGDVVLFARWKAA